MLQLGNTPVPQQLHEDTQWQAASRKSAPCQKHIYMPPVPVRGAHELSWDAGKRARARPRGHLSDVSREAYM